MPSTTIRHPFGVIRSSFWLVSTSAVLLLTSITVQAQSGGAQPPPPKVPVISLQGQSADVYKEYAGSTEANRHVEVRAQVDGILESREYIEGAWVEKGQPLFRIDSRPFEAALHRAEADLLSAQATLAAAQRDWRRMDSLFGRGVASEKQRDDARSALETAQAGVKVAEAQLESAQINLDYTTVAAPIPGIAG